ncbi:hypothetical protein KI387_041648, partial [Taxus chinensis]
LISGCAGETSSGPGAGYSRSAVGLGGRGGLQQGKIGVLQGQLAQHSTTTAQAPTTSSFPNPHAPRAQ